MLSEKDLKRLEDIERVIDAEDMPSLDNIRWLCGKVRAVRFARPDEFDFPTYACLINLEKQVAYALRYFETPGLRRETEISKGALREGVEVFSATPVFPETDGLLIVRPWVRPVAGTSEDLFEEIRQCSLSLSFDGKSLIDKRPIESFLMTPEGAGLRTTPELLVHQPGAHVHLAACLKGNEGDPSQPLGCFVVTNTRISLALVSPAGRPSDKLKVVAGLTCARYTTSPEQPNEFTKQKHPSACDITG